jgi:serine/threonine-protein kinase
MPPEQVLDFSSARPAADQYAAAASLYYLLTGQGVYEKAANMMQQMVRILETDPFPIRQGGPPLPADLAAVFRRALARDPQQRFADVLALRQALARCG